MSKGSGMMVEVGAINEAAKHQAKTGEEMDLPVGGKVADSEEEVPAVEASSDSPAEEVAAVVEEDKGPVTEIKIGDQVFTNQADAIKYAEVLAQEKMINESYQMGVREAMRAQAPVAQAPVVEENFEEKFYSDPKGTLKNIEASAVQTAIETIRAEQNKENLWKTFFDKYPDLAGHRSICDHVLKENMQILGNMQDTDKAMAILATKTRSVFQSYNDAQKPRSEMPRKSSQAVSTGNASNPGVTQNKKVERVLTMAEQMRSLKGH